MTFRIRHGLGCAPPSGHILYMNQSIRFRLLMYVRVVQLTKLFIDVCVMHAVKGTVWLLSTCTIVYDYVHANSEWV